MTNSPSPNQSGFVTPAYVPSNVTGKNIRVGQFPLTLAVPQSDPPTAIDGRQQHFLAPLRASGHPSLPTAHRGTANCRSLASCHAGTGSTVSAITLLPRHRVVRHPHRQIDGASIASFLGDGPTPFSSTAQEYQSMEISEPHRIVKEITSDLIPYGRYEDHYCRLREERRYVSGSDNAAVFFV